MTKITQDGINYSAFSSDVLAAYLNSLMWAITGDTRHAEKCVEIFNAWVNVTEFTGGGTESLNTGRVIWKLLEAAEIIKSTYDGWAPEDIEKFKAMLVLSRLLQYTSACYFEYLQRNLLLAHVHGRSGPSRKPGFVWMARDNGDGYFYG